MTEVFKDSFETRMKIREFDAKIKNLAKTTSQKFSWGTVSKEYDKTFEELIIN